MACIMLCFIYYRVTLSLGGAPLLCTVTRHQTYPLIKIRLHWHLGSYKVGLGPRSLLQWFYGLLLMISVPIRGQCSLARLWLTLPLLVPHCQSLPMFSDDNSYTRVSVTEVKECCCHVDTHKDQSWDNWDSSMGESVSPVTVVWFIWFRLKTKQN